MPPSTADQPDPSTSPGLAVAPFRALTYAGHDEAELARVSSPAYDLVTAAGRERLAAADPHNVVRLILPGGPAGGGPAGTSEPPPAQLAAATLRAWRAEQVLVRDERPAVWLYRMSGPADQHTTGWLAAVTLPPPGSSAVLPHEDTYAPAVEGRRLLLAATATDLEPIVLAHDPDDEIGELSARWSAGEPDLAVDDPDGVQHRLWRVGDPATTARLQAAFARTRAVIADGHHRFAAARAARLDGAADKAILALLTPMGPGGLRVQAIHRVVPELSLDRAVELATAGFTVRELPPSDVGTGVHRSAHDGDADWLVTDGHRAVALSAPTPEVLSRVPSGAPPSWRGLDVVVAHHGLLTALWGRRDVPEEILVAHHVPEALRLAEERRGVALLLPSPSPSDVAAVARAGARMPRKSTLFVPKPRTGLVMRPHDD